MPHSILPSAVALRMVGDRSNVPIFTLPEAKLVDRVEAWLAAIDADGENDLGVGMGAEIGDIAALHLGRVHHAIEHRHVDAQALGEAGAAVIEADIADLVIAAHRLLDAELGDPFT